MSEQLMVKDLLAYHIREEQKKLKEHQERLAAFFEAYSTDEPCSIDLSTIELPFDQQPINTASAKALYMQGQLIAGNNFAAYDIRRLWKLKILSIEPASYPCERADLSFAGIWIIEFEGNIRINFHGHLTTVLSTLCVDSELGKVEDIDENTIYSGGEFFNLHVEERRLTTFQRSHVLQYIATRSSIYQSAKAGMDKDVKHVLNGQLHPLTTYVGKAYMESNDALHLRKGINSKDAVVINLARVFDKYRFGKIDEDLYRASSTLSHWRHSY